MSDDYGYSERRNKGKDKKKNKKKNPYKHGGWQRTMSFPDKEKKE